MIIALWILNAFLALAFLAAGTMKLARPKTALQAAGMSWTEDYPSSRIKAIGAAEVVGAFGLILPLLTGIAPVLAPIAATLLAVLMIGAVVTHVRRKENSTPSIVLAVLSIASAVLGFLVIA